jgi:hypothetical protein
MLRDEQIEIRRQRAKADNYRIENVGKNRVFSDFRVTNPVSGGEYTVAVRGFDTGDNTCTCPDFRANTLGTCKHIEAVLEDLKEDNPAHVQKKKAAVTRPEVYLHYGEALKLGVLLPPRHTDKLGDFAKRYFDDRGLWSGRGKHEDFLADVERVPEEVVVRSDARDFLRRELERLDLQRKEGEWLKQIDDGTFDAHLLSVPLYDYQLRGAVFLAGRGRAILGDDMGLGKTLQSLAAVELLARERGISRVLVVAPASVKYQWEGEVKRFTRRAVQVIEGGPDDRKDQYSAATFYRLVNYEQVVRDRDAINAWKPDVIVLDEAQRIKNWASKTSQAVKKLVSRYAVVLTGTPLENKLEELYSIVQFVDERRFGPAFQFLQDHRVLDEKGNLTGYRNLDKIRERLEPIFLRRTRTEVLTQLPGRTDNTVYVELSDEQRVPYEEQRTTLARLLGKSFLTDPDRKRVLACLANLRLICDSTFLFDKTTHHSPKLDEFAEVVPELLGPVPLSPGGEGDSTQARRLLAVGDDAEPRREGARHPEREVRPSTRRDEREGPQGGHGGVQLRPRVPRVPEHRRRRGGAELAGGRHGREPGTAVEPGGAGTADRPRPPPRAGAAGAGDQPRDPRHGGREGAENAGAEAGAVRRRVRRRRGRDRVQRHQPRRLPEHRAGADRRGEGGSAGADGGRATAGE